jgi:vitamin B12 transporter
MSSFVCRARLAVLPLACSVAFPSLAQTTLPTVVVSATRSEIPITDVVADVTLLDRITIDRLGVASVSEVLERLPGVTVNRNGGPATTTSVYLRGAEGRFTAVFIDGVRIDSQSTGGATWNAIPLSQVDRIEVLRGPAAAVYGSDAMAGVIQIFTRQGEKGFFPSLRLSVGSNSTLELGASLRGGDGVVDYAFGLGAERSDGFNAQPSGNPDRDGYRNRSFSGRLGWNVSDGQKLEATVLDSHQNAGYDGFSPGLDDRSRHRLQTVGLTWTRRWSEDWNTRVGVSRGTDWYETSPSVYLTETKVEGWLLRNELRVGPGQLTVDLERRQDRLENASTEPVNTRRHQNALGMGYGLRAGDHTLQLNLRRDDDSEFGVQNTGSVAYGYALSKTLQLTGSLGTAFRAPTLFQRFSIYGTPDLRAETARNVEAGLRWQEAASRASVVVYRNRVKDLIDYVAGPGSCVNGAGDFAGCYGNTGRATYTGVTLAGGTRLGEWNLGGSLDLMRPKNAETGKQLARRSEVQAKLTADLPLGAWRLGGELQHLGKRYDDAANTRPLPAHTLLNLSASTDVARDWRLLARVDNATDRDYESVLGYATAGRTVYLGLTWAPR